MSPNEPTSRGGPLRVLYDGACPFCRAEIEWLRRRDRRGRLVPEDISAPGFDASLYGLDPADVQRVLHVISADGKVVRRMEAVRAVYQVLGLGWLVAPTGWPVLRAVFDRLYTVFARNRRSWGAAWPRWWGRRGPAPRPDACARCSD